ncbi:hypothetical protein BJ170DRAFT_282868 [Xylariales sp. AK1849]|nr:hypothetical protein BJ170DRAFT_282868 [Xylariales sp. AK1849]
MNSFCGSWSLGSCCSSSSFCGSTDAHCGAGCQSGCPSTHGTCGVQNKFGSCPAGQCCSSGGKCGSGDAFCGSGCQSGSRVGGSDGPVYIAPKIWTEPNPTLQCYQPCTFVLPPQTLPSALTISIPPATEMVEETWPLTVSASTTIYSTVTKTVSITIPAFTTSVVPYSNVEWTDSVSTSIFAGTSIVPTAVTLTETSDLLTVVWTYSPGPYPTPTAPWDSNMPPPATQVHTSFPVHTGPPGPLCSSGCGSLCRHNCGPPGVPPVPSLNLPCIGFSCGGGGGDGGGGGGNCAGPDCYGPRGGGGSDGEDEGECEETKTASLCEVVCTKTDQPCSTSCLDIEGCSPTGSTTTVSSSTGLIAPATTMPPYDGQEIVALGPSKGSGTHSLPTTRCGCIPACRIYLSSTRVA